MDTSALSAQLLAEFVAAVSTAETGAAAACAAVERTAEALDAEVAAIVCDGELVAAVGSAPVAELARVQPGVVDAWLQVPGGGSCAAAAVTLDIPPALPSCSPDRGWAACPARKPGCCGRWPWSPR